MFKAQKYKKVSTLNIIFNLFCEMRDSGCETRTPKHGTHINLNLRILF